MNALESTLEELFVGSFHHALDPKRRLIIPSVWRSMLGFSPVCFPPSGVVLPASVHDVGVESSVDSVA